MQEIDRTDFRMNCIRIAVEKVKDGKYEEALRFLEIIKRPHQESSKVLEDFIDELRAVIQNNSTISTRITDITDDITDISDSIFMESQLRLVQEVLKQKNFYRILNVRNDASELDIKKSYKRLLLQLHPDKNCSPDAASAFQMVNKAYAVLSDEAKRSRYDAAGGCGTNFSDFDKSGFTYAPKPPSKTHKFKQIFGDILFAGTDSMSKSMQTFRGTTTRTLLGSLSVAVFLALATIFVTQSNQLFSFSETSKFNVRQVTHRLRIPYYVKANFLETYNGDLTEFENDIETQFVTIAEITCKNERRERDNAMIRARQSGNHWEYARIFSIRLKSCDVLMRLGLFRQQHQT